MAPWSCGSHQLRREKFRVAELDMNLDGLLVSAMGEVPLEGSQSLQLRVLGNAGGLRPLFGSVESLPGILMASSTYRARLLNLNSLVP